MNSFFIWLANKKSQRLSKIQEEEFTELERIWNLSAEFDVPDIPTPEQGWAEIESKLSMQVKSGKVRKLSPPKWFYASAASVLIFFCAWGVYKSAFTDTYQSYNTHLNIILSDSTQITLNKHSKLWLATSFNKTHRKVNLQGEAYFKVTKSKLPFIVKTKSARVEVVGTMFNVKARKNKTELGVNQGVVDFYVPRNKKETGVRLTKGLFSVCANGKVPTEPCDILFGDFPAWLHGRMAFQNANLSDVCDEIEIQFSTKLKIEDQAIKQMNVSGLLAGETVEEVLEVLCSLIQKNYKKEANCYVLY